MRVFGELNALDPLGGLGERRLRPEEIKRSVVVVRPTSRPGVMMNPDGTLFTAFAEKEEANGAQPKPLPQCPEPATSQNWLGELMAINPMQAARAVDNGGDPKKTLASSFARQPTPEGGAYWQIVAYALGEVVSPAPGWSMVDGWPTNLAATPTAADDDIPF